MNRRAMLGAGVIVAWVVGIALLVHRQYFQPEVERLAEAATRITPGAVYYGVMQGDRQIGFASSTVDTTTDAITVVDYFVADLPVGGKARRATARTDVTLSRALRMRKFTLSLDTEGAPIDATGDVEGDSVLVLGIASGRTKPDTQRVSLTGPILLPTLVPLAVALGERPSIGKQYVLPVFDPASMAPKDMRIEVRAESLFVVNDSAVYDSATKQWRGIQPDSMHAWQIATEGNGGFSGWIDEQGRIMQTTQLGLTLRRLPYEVAHANWHADSASAGTVSEDRDILESTAIAADRQMTGNVNTLVVRLSNVSLQGFDLDGGRQRLHGDTLFISAVPDSALAAAYLLPQGRQIDPANTRAEPLIQSDDPRMMRLAFGLEGSKRDPRVVAERINAWVHDHVKDRITFGVPSALQVLDSRVGDCNEHTQLFVALARAVGLPARIAAGLAYVDGKFYYHAWPEVYLHDWVAVDPTFGQFPADAAHLRFVIGGLGRQTELLRLMGNLKIDVLAVNGAANRSTAAQ